MYISLLIFFIFCAKLQSICKIFNYYALFFELFNEILRKSMHYFKVNIKNPQCIAH